MSIFNACPSDPATAAIVLSVIELCGIWAVVGGALTYLAMRLRQR